jgi:iron complex transport system substrate-binding protein
VSGDLSSSAGADRAAGGILPRRGPGRRRVLGTAAGTLAGAAGLAACGGGGRSASQGASPSRSAPATRRVSTPKGTVTVPGSPHRIVAIQPSAFATLRDVGFSVAGVYDEGEQYVSPRYRTSYHAAPKVGSGGQVDVEKVAALDPDLIIGVDYPWNTSVYSELTALAPTVIAPATSWEATARTVAEAVGATARIDALQQRITTRSEKIKSAYADVLAKYRWDILQGGFDSGQFWLYGPGSDVGRILAGAGVRFATASTRSPGQANRSLSYEKIDVLSDADVIGFYADWDGKPSNQGPRLFAQQGFKRLAADREGRLYPFPDFLPGGYGDALAVLDELESALRKLRAAS